MFVNKMLYYILVCPCFGANCSTHYFSRVISIILDVISVISVIVLYCDALDFAQAFHNYKTLPEKEACIESYVHAIMVTSSGQEFLPIYLKFVDSVYDVKLNGSQSRIGYKYCSFVALMNIIKLEYVMPIRLKSKGRSFRRIIDAVAVAIVRILA